MNVIIVVWLNVRVCQDIVLIYYILAVLSLARGVNFFGNAFTNSLTSNRPNSVGQRVKIFLEGKRFPSGEIGINLFLWPVLHA